VPHPVLFEREKQLLQLARADSIHASPTVGGHEVEALGVCFDQAGNKGTFPLFEEFENAGFVLEARSCIGSLEGFVNQAVVAEADKGTGGIFGILHLIEGNTGHRKPIRKKGLVSPLRSDPACVKK